MSLRYVAILCKRTLVALRDRRNPLKAFVLMFVYCKAKILCCLFGITKVSSYLSLLDEDCTKMVLETFGATIGRDCDIGSHILVHNAHPDFRNLKIGNGCHIGRDTFFDLRALITIEDFVTISMRTTIITHTSVGKSSLSNRYPRSSAFVRIKKNSYVGANSIILQGVTIGEESFIAAGSLVVSDVQRLTMVRGVHAKIIKNLNRKGE